MKLIEFNCTFIYLKKKFQASCQKFKVHKYPQYRLVYLNPETKMEEVYVFYEVNRSRQLFFAFSRGKKGDEVAKAMMIALQKMAPVD
ncbi:MAG TPA: hypothetical protein VGO09_03850 [Flavisolibacter sp.]|nr:hypothetical protein [Flavisolibacter sp.]